MHFQILTLFPDFFTSPLQSSILSKAQEKNILKIDVHNIRDFSDNKHRSVDAPPYGGGSGMLLQPEPVACAIENAKTNTSNVEVIYFSPSGQKMTQEVATKFAQNKTDKILLCGHYEGIDERVLSSHVDHHICIGESVLMGGEIPALYFLDSVSRLIPEVIGKENSHSEETFSNKLYSKGEYPQFTRPENWREIQVPKVLLSGDHKKIETWKYTHLKNISSGEQKILHLRRNVFSVDKPKKYRYFSLRVPKENDISIWLQWFANPKVCQYTRIEPNQTYQSEQYFYNWQHNNLKLLLLQIIEKQTKKNIGSVSLELDETEENAKLGLIIGEVDFWNKGFGTKIVEEMCDIGFQDLQLRQISLDVYPENKAAQKVYEKCGFISTGYIHQQYKKEEKFQKILLYEKQNPNLEK